MNRYILSLLTVSALGSVPSIAIAEEEHAHFDIAPYLVDGKLLTGGLDHSSNHFAPPISVYGYEFGEDPYDPFNPSDPGVNQSAGTGNLPSGAKLEYDILSSLLYWDGVGEVNWISATDAVIGLSMGTTMRKITGTSGVQDGSLIQTVGSGGTVHKHFVTSLYANSAASLDPLSNVPDEISYVEPLAGIYAYSLNLTLTNGSNVYTSDPVWVVFNNGLSEAQHEAAVAAVPEPSSMAVLSLGGLALLKRRRKMENQ